MKKLFTALLLALGLMIPQAALAQTTPAPGGERPRIMIVRVFTTDIDRAEHFYRTVFGWNAPQAFGADNKMFGAPSPTAPSLLLVRATEARANPFLAIAVNDTAAIMAAVEANGGTVQRPASSQGHGMPIGFITDPDGTTIELIQIPSAPPAGAPAAPPPAHH